MTEENLNTLFEEHKYEEIIEATEADGNIVFDANKLALSYFHTERHEQAAELFSRVCSKSENPVDWFNLCTSSILSGKEREGLDALRTAIKLNRETQTNGKGISTPFMHLYATQALLDAGKYNLAFNQLNELAEVYRTLSITDTHYLYTRGIPLFEEFVKLSGRVLGKQTVTDSKEWIDYISSPLDDEGKNSLGNINQNLMA